MSTAYSSADAPAPRRRPAAAARLYGREYHYATEAPSTQRMLPPGAPHGAVALTEHQTEGRGRLGRTWVDEPGTGLALLGRAAAAAAGRALARADPRRRRSGRRRGRAGRRRSSIRTTCSRRAARWRGSSPRRSERVVLGIGVNVGTPPGRARASSTATVSSCSSSCSSGWSAAMTLAHAGQPVTDGPTFPPASWATAVSSVTVPE